MVEHQLLVYFDMGVEKKGFGILPLHVCTENRHILVIVDWPLIGVDSLQRRSPRK